VETIVLGLDGGDWDLIRPWIEDGSLPNLRSIRADGLWSVSRSVLPPVTCPNWKCYASSTSPGGHDVYWWDVVDREECSVSVPDSTSFTAPELWDYLNDEGISTGVVNLPMSYPPRSVDGLMVSGGPQSREVDYTHPAGLEDTLEEKFGYRVRPRKAVRGEANRGVDETLALIEKRFRTAESLVESHDLQFLHLTVFYLNVIQHFYGRAPPTKRAWEIIDEWVGRFRTEAETLFLVSDHGCTEIETEFYVNEWLSSEGHLITTDSYVNHLQEFGLTQERFVSLVGQLQIEPFLREHLPRNVLDLVPTSDGATRQAKFDTVDTVESSAIASGQGVLYVLEDPHTEAYATTREAIVEGLRGLQTPDGTEVAETVHVGEAVYPDGDPQYRPDIVFEQNSGIHTSDAVGHDSIFDTPTEWVAENRRDGLFAAVGDAIEPAGKLDPISILDIAPTVLYNMGLDVPTDFDGSPVREANATDESVTYRPPLPDRGQTDRSGAGVPAVQDRLSDLGYLD